MVLNLCDGSRSIEEIAGHIQSEYPKRYKNQKDAVQGVLSIVRSLVQINEEVPINIAT